MSFVAPLLAADWGTVIWIIAVILFFVVPAIGQALGKLFGQQKPAPPRRVGGAPVPQRAQPIPQRAQPAPQRAQPAPQRAQQPAARGLDDEISEFLRRAARGQAGQAQQPGRPRPAAPPPRPARKPEPVLEAEVVEEVGARPVGARLDTKEFASRSAKLGGEVVGAERQFEQHLQEAFDHKLGDLGGKQPKAKAPAQAEPAPMPPAAAAGFAALLGSAEDIRQAIVLNEILTRPVDRWQ
jgi:hypothetical protein